MTRSGGSRSSSLTKRSYTSIAYVSVFAFTLIAANMPSPPPSLSGNLPSDPGNSNEAGSRRTLKEQFRV